MGRSNWAASGQTQAHLVSDLTQPRYKKVFIPRDYTEGLRIKFVTVFKQDLEGFVEPEVFHYMVNTVNSLYEEGEQMTTRVFFESCIACLTAYLICLCADSQFVKCEKKVSNFIKDQNASSWNLRGLTVTDPLDRGLRCIEITIALDRAKQLMHASAQLPPTTRNWPTTTTQV